MRPGDEIHLVYGSKLPLILRPLQSGEDEEIMGLNRSNREIVHDSRQQHPSLSSRDILNASSSRECMLVRAEKGNKLIGPCFVHGIMDGEGMTEDARARLGTVYIR